MAKKEKITKEPELGKDISEAKKQMIKERIEVDKLSQAKNQRAAKKISSKLEENWEVKDRTYYLVGNKQPLSYSMKSRGIHWFDEDKGYERELKLTSNQTTCFVDEFKGDQERLTHIIFRNGALFVPRNKVVLQKMLSLYHPFKDQMYKEWLPELQAVEELDWLEFEAEALIAAKNLDVDLTEAVLRAEIGSEVSNMTSKQLKRDLMIFAKKSPRLFLELVTDDNIQLRNFGIKATEAGVINLSGDQRTFTWGSTNRKLMNVPFDEHPYSALAAWFKTDEGMDIYKQIEKRM